jgi:hypothetical protein
MSSFQYDDSQLITGLTRFEHRVKNAIRQVATYWAGVFENYAKENARWKDQTANARQSLHAFVEELTNDTVALYIAHGVDYGIQLETKYAGRYAIIWETIETHLVQIRQMLQRIFG